MGHRQCLGQPLLLAHRNPQFEKADNKPAIIGYSAAALGAFVFCEWLIHLPVMNVVGGSCSSCCPAGAERGAARRRPKAAPFNSAAATAACSTQPCPRHRSCSASPSSCWASS
jgi:hypothetical protein